MVVGHWQNPQVQARIDRWIRVAAAVYDSRRMKVARFGDNMREVARITSYNVCYTKLLRFTA